MLLLVSFYSVAVPADCVVLCPKSELKGPNLWFLFSGYRRKILDNWVVDTFLLFFKYIYIYIHGCNENPASHYISVCTLFLCISLFFLFYFWHLKRPDLSTWHLFSENELAADTALQMRHSTLDSNKCNMLHNRNKLETSVHFSPPLPTCTVNQLTL